MEMEVTLGHSSSGEMWIKRAEIDTRAPFSSVREAVSLFGERVLASEVYARSLKPEHARYAEVSKANEAAGGISAELEETRLSLRKAREKELLMESRLFSLEQELERTKQELQQVKTEPDSSSSSPSVKLPTTDEEDSDEAEHVKFIEDNAVNKNSGGDDGYKVEFRKKRYVTFSDPPLVARVIVPESGSVLQRQPSLKTLVKKKRKGLIPLIEGIFRKSKKHDGDPVVGRSSHHRLESSIDII